MELHRLFELEDGRILIALTCDNKKLNETIGNAWMKHWLIVGANFMEVWKPLTQSAPVRQEILLPPLFVGKTFQLLHHSKAIRLIFPSLDTQQNYIDIKLLSDIVGYQEFKTPQEMTYLEKIRQTQSQRISIQQLSMMLYGQQLGFPLKVERLLPSRYSIFDMNFRGKKICICLQSHNFLYTPMMQLKYNPNLEYVFWCDMPICSLIDIPHNHPPSLLNDKTQQPIKIRNEVMIPETYYDRFTNYMETNACFVTMIIHKGI